MLQGGILSSSMVAFVSFSCVAEGNFTGLTSICTTMHLKAAASAGVTPDTAPWALAVLGGCWPLAVSGLWQWRLVPVAAHP